MVGLSYEQIVEKIKSQANVSEEEINAKVNEKLDKLSNLISKEGAAHIVANELGVKVFEAPKGGRLKIKELQPMQRNIEVLGKVQKLYGVREFKTQTREGKVGSFLVGDDTGLTRITVWDEPLMPDVEKLKEDDTVLVKGAYVKENNGYKEVHLGSGAQILINPPGETVENVVQTGQKPEATVKKISELNERDFAAVTGTIVQVFEPRFYEACTECGKKVNPETKKCNEHQSAQSQLMPVVNIIFDDGSENIRIVAFRDQAESLLGLDREKLVALKDNFSDFDELRSKILGKQIKVTGRVVKNDMFGKLEMVANNVEEVDAKELLNELKTTEEVVS